MTNEERYRKYINEYCHSCRNKDKDLCDIRILVLDKTVVTRCAYYERIMEQCVTHKCKECKFYNNCFKEENKEGEKRW